MATKKTATKKAPAKKRSTKTSKSSVHTPRYVSFRRSPEERPFMKFEITRQTFYWTLISIIVLILGAYTIYLQMRISEIYDQVDMNGTHSSLDSREIEKLRGSDN